MSLWAMETLQKSKPRPFKPERVGHPEKQNRSPGVDVLEWYHPAVRVRQEENAKGWATRHPERQTPSLGVDVLEWYHPAVRVRQEENAKGWATRLNMYGC